MRKCPREDILSLCRAGTIARVRHGRRVEGLNLKNSVVGRGAGVATAGRTGARISVSPRHPENSWAVNAKTSFRAVLYCGIDFRLELVVTVPVVGRAARLPSGRLALGPGQRGLVPLTGAGLQAGRVGRT